MFPTWKLLATGAILLTAACGGEQRKAVVSGKLADSTLYRVLDDEVSTLDPHKANTVIDLRVANDLFQGLTSYGPDGQIEPGLAERWDVAPSGLQWRFKLRALLTFSDGTPLDAADVVASLRRAVDPRTAAPMARLLMPIRNAEAIIRGTLPPSELGVAAVGRDEVQIQLERPAGEFLEVLANPVAAVVPVSRIDVAGEGWAKPDVLVTSGPFQVLRHIMHAALELEKNTKFHDAAHVSLQRVVYYPMSDKDTAIRKFRAGEVDLVPDFNRSQYEVMKREAPQAIHIGDYRGTYYFVFNTRRPPFNTTNVRCALSMAIDRDILARQVVGIDHRPSYSIVPPAMPGYGAAVVPAWAQHAQNRRLADAAKLLAASGYSAARPLAFEIRFNSSEDHKRIALAFSQMWKTLPVKVTLFNTEASVHFASLKAGEFELARSGWIADYNGADSFLGVYDRDAGVMNYSGFSDSRFDSLYSAARHESGAAQRIDGFRAAEQLLADACVVMPVYTYRTKNLVSPAVQGWVDNFANVNPSRYLSVKRRKEAQP